MSRKYWNVKAWGCERMLKAIKNKIPDVFLSILVAFSLTYALASSSLCMEYPPLKMLLIAALGITALSFLFHNRKTSIVSIIVLCAAFAAGVVHLLISTGIGRIAEAVSKYGLWLYDYIIYPYYTEPLYEKITVIIVCIAVTALSYIFVIKKFNFYVILIAGMGLFGFQASYNIVATNVPFYIFLLAALMSYLKYISGLKASKENNVYAKPGTLIMWSIPVSILIIGLSILMHASDKPITWKWLDQKFLSAYNYFQKKFDYESYDYFSLSATSGFGDSSSFLGGKVTLDRKSVLKVYTDKRVYLSGASRDIYTGNMWKNSNAELEQLDAHFSGLYDDTSEMMTGMKVLTGRENYFSDYFDSTQTFVSFLNLKTRSMFKPPKIKELGSISEDVSVNMSDTGDISSDSRLKKDFQYNMKAYVPKMSTEFEELMRKSKQGLYEEYIQKLKFPSYYDPEPFIYNFTSLKPPEEETAQESDSVDSATVDIDSVDSDTIDVSADQISTENSDTEVQDPEAEVTDDAADSSQSTVTTTTVVTSNNKEIKRYEMLKELGSLSEKSKQIYSKYLQLPDNLPQRVKDLSVSLTASADNNYDKAKAIERYLASNYSYNLDVPPVPRDRDFVDYFLFDQTEGYCTYFASAMAILARCAGLPARYVEGYMLPPEPVEDSSNWYIVTNMQAHAWVEIYFEGYGWLPFEPTPPFRSAFYTVDVPEQVSFGTSYDNSYQDYMQMMMKYYSDMYTGGMIDIGIEEPEEEMSDNVIILICTGSVIVLMLLVMLFNLLRSKIRTFRILNLPARDCVIRSYEYFLKVLKLHGKGITSSETPFQYSERIDSEMFFSPVRFGAITDIFVKSRYSQNDVSEKERLLYSDFYPGFLSEIKINMGKFKYFIFRYILGKI
jgi:transglutaminase-like putative cysteine protease